MASTMTKARHPASEWEVGVTRLFGNYDLDSAGLLSGWAPPEDSHIWNDGPEAVLQITTESAKGPLRLSFEGTPFLDGNIRHQDVTLYVNGWRLGFWRLAELKSYILTVTVEPEHVIEREGKTILTCAIYIPNSARPVELGTGEDGRELGFCFRSVTISEGA